MGRVNFTIKNNLLHSHDPYNSPAQVLISNQPYTNVPSFPLKMNLASFKFLTNPLHVCSFTYIYQYNKKLPIPIFKGIFGRTQHSE